MIEYRKMTDDDIDAGLALCRSAGWNQLANDWKIFLELDPDGNRVAIDENNKVVGTVTTVTYEDHFSWIGMVLVDPSKKRQGIGTQLLREALKILEQQETIKLDATPAGREVYLKLRFKDEYILSRMVAADISKLPSNNLEQISLNDLNVIFQTDENVFGASRAALLKKIHESHPQFSFQIKKRNSISYSFGRKGFNFTQVGPIVADKSDEAIQLATAAFKNISGAVALDVMKGSAFHQWLTSIGFTEQRELIRMYRGKNAYPGTPEKQFAILGPEFG